MRTDYLVIGAGLTGGVIARAIKDAGLSVVVVDRRSHIGGNVHDHVHESGIRVHTYGPHYFRTSSDRIWEFVNRFSSFYKYEPSLKSLVDGRLENWPIAQSYIKRAIGTNWKPEFEGNPQNFEEASLSMMPKAIYEKFVKGYTEKQWGIDPKFLDTKLAGRFDVRLDDEPRLKTQKYQGIPRFGYATFMSNLFEGIPVILNFDYLKNRESFKASTMTIFTGPIDEFFDYSQGRLRYRGQRREHSYHADTDWFQECGQVNNPDHSTGEHIRTLEWKHMLPKEFADRIKGTLITREFPISPTKPDEFEYPFPDEANKKLYSTYRDRADSTQGLLICGRLGEYRYFDMDQAIGRAMTLATRILGLRSLQGAEETIRSNHLTSKLLEDSQTERTPERPTQAL